MKRVNQKLCQKLMIVEEKLQMHKSNQVIYDQNDDPPSSPWTQFVTKKIANQGDTHEMVPSTKTMDKF